MTLSEKMANTPTRIAKVIARSGLCSRRDAEKWIEQGRISVNGKRLDSPAFNVTSNDKILVDGKPLPETESVRLWLYHKPKGLVTTHKDPEGRATVFDHLPPDTPRVISIGRLDINTEGLLLLTNDGRLARHLELPSTGWTRKYRVRANGRVTEEQLSSLRKGLTVEGVQYGPIEASLERLQGANCWINVSLREGKNREVKNVLGALGLEVNRLIRIAYGPFQLGELQPGSLEEIKRKVLHDQLDKKLAQELGLQTDKWAKEKKDTKGTKKGAIGKKPFRQSSRSEQGSPEAQSTPSSHRKSSGSKKQDVRNASDRTIRGKTARAKSARPSNRPGKPAEGGRSRTAGKTGPTSGKTRPKR